MEFTESERQTLIACAKIRRRGSGKLDRESVVKRAKRIFEDRAVDLDEGLRSLELRGALLPKEGSLELGPSWLEKAKGLDTDFECRNFDDWLLRSEASAAYRDFCLRVYATPFVQFGMVDAEELEALLAVHELGKASRVLDLGCGLGTQAEYLSDRTGASVLGLDFAPGAVERAKARSAGKRERLEFRLGNLDRLDPSLGAFDLVYSLDSLYFVDELEAVVASAFSLLVPGGVFAAFYTEDIGEGASSESLEPGGTKLAQALLAAGAEFTAKEFSANERRIWKASLEEATALKAAFEAEGNLDLWRTRDEEARSMLALYEACRARRYLYRALRRR